MALYKVDVYIELHEGTTAAQADIDDMEPRSYDIEAETPEQAKQQALDSFHAEVAIGNLNYVTVIAEAYIDLTTIPHIIVLGDIAEGFIFYGPFPTFLAAAEYADGPNNMPDRDWWITALHPVEDLKEQRY